MPDYEKSAIIVGASFGIGEALDRKSLRHYLATMQAIIDSADSVSGRER